MAPTSETTCATRPRALVAEDQADVVEAIRMVLKQEGADVEAVTSPQAVLDALSSNRFDVAIVDMNYARDTTSGAEGLDLLKCVQQIDRTVPVIVMTAWGSVELAVEAMRRGAADFIQKPWDNWQLAGVIRKQIQRRAELCAIENEHDRDMREACELQTRLLPRRLRQIPGVEIAVDWRAARTLGGDYFDVLRFDDGSVGLCIADVEGKGVPAALVMSNLQSAVKALAGPLVDPKDLCERLNGIFCEEVHAERSISFFYARLHPGARRLTYANAGHWPPLLIHRGGGEEGLERGGTLLGRLTGWSYEQADVILGRGDLLVLFTDGVSEAEDEFGEEFGAERLSACVRACDQMTAAELQREVLASVAQHCHDRFRDDATLMVVRVE